MKLSHTMILFTLLLALLLTGCSLRPTPSAAPEATLPPPAEPDTQEPPEDAMVETFLSNMTIEEKVGQLFFVRPDALDPSQAAENGRGVQEMTAALGNALVRYPVGGVVIFARNIDSPEQLRAFLADLQRASKTPLIFAVDEEGGAVTRLAERSDFGLPRYSSAAAVGREGAEAVKAMGTAIGGYLREYGFTMDFAPVADVYSDPTNPVIGLRAFSGEAESAAVLSGTMAAALRAAGITPVYKHFPGHGNTVGDSHTGLAVCYATLEELRGCEWLPYTTNDLTGCGVMVGHIALPAVTGEMTPASLSEKIVGGYLRGEIGFDGLVITDSLAMGGVLVSYTNEQAAVAALQAGCDVLLMPDDLPGAYRAVLSAVQSGELTESRIDESVRRILRCKLQAGLMG